MSDNESIRLKDMVHSLASTMVVTSQFLDQSTVDLQNLYAHSGSGALAAMTPPRFTLDEVTIDLSFVVEEVSMALDGESPEAPTGEVRLTESQRRSLLDKLEKLTAEEKEEWQAWEAEQEQLLVEERKYQSDLKSFETKKARLEEELGNIEGGIEHAEEQVTARNHNVEVLEAKREQASESQAQEAVEAQLESENRALGNLQELLEGLRSERTRVDTQLSALAEQAPKPPEVAAADAESPKPSTPKDHAGVWLAFENDYLRLKAAYIKALDAFERRQPLPKIKPFAEPSAELLSALPRAGVTAKTLGKVEKIYADQEKTLENLGQIASLVAERKGNGIKVRVDPEAIREAPETARQKISLTFRSESQENVQLEGEQLDIAK